MYQQLIEHIGEPFYSSLSSYDKIDQKIIGSLVQKKLKPLDFDFEITCAHDPLQRWSLWQFLLKAILLALFEDKLDSKIKIYKEKWYKLKEQQSFQAFSIELLYAKITAHFLKIEETSFLEITQTKSGFCSLYSENHWRFFKVPFIDQHAEFATLLLLLGKLTQNPSLVNQGYKSALWHTKNIDPHFTPYRGFLSNHLHTDYFDVVLKQGILLHLASLALEDKEMAFLAKSHFSFILKAEPYQLKKISLSSLLVWKLINQLFQNQLTPVHVDLSSETFEEEMPIAGYRSEKISLLCSLTGNNSSMGTLKFDDLEIAAFGPQLSDLGDGKGFGFIGLNENEKNFELQKKSDAFTLKKVVGLPHFTIESSLLNMWQHPKCWLDTKLTYEKEYFTVKIKPLRLNQEVYFVFYVIADQCLIKGEKKILYQSLEQFQGKACSVSFLNKTKIMTFDPLLKEGSMKIIPLEGGQSFWGANYLIAYHLNNKYSTFEWKITCSNR